MKTKSSIRKIDALAAVLLIFSLLAAACPLFAGNDDSNRRLDDLSRNQILQFGSGYLINTTLNDSFARESENDVYFKNMIENTAIGKGVSSPVPEQFDLKGPRGGGGGPVKTGLKIDEIDTAGPITVDPNVLYSPNNVTDPGYISPEKIAPIIRALADASGGATVIYHNSTTTRGDPFQVDENGNCANAEEILLSFFGHISEPISAEGLQPLFSEVDMEARGGTYDSTLHMFTGRGDSIFLSAVIFSMYIKDGVPETLYEDYVITVSPSEFNRVFGFFDPVETRCQTWYKYPTGQYISDYIDSEFHPVYTQGYTPSSNPVTTPSSPETTYTEYTYTVNPASNTDKNRNKYLQDDKLLLANSYGTRNTLAPDNSADKSALSQNLLGQDSLRGSYKEAKTLDKPMEKGEEIADTKGKNIVTGIAKESSILEEVIFFLQNKKGRTGIEETLLNASKAVMEESLYMDDNTLQEFEQAVNTLLIAESVKDEMGEAGFKALEDALAGLVIEQKTLYDNYLKETETTYLRICEALGIDPDKDELPDNYALIYNLNILAKRKILADIALEQIRTRDKVTLTEREKEALKTESDCNLQSKRRLYLNALNRMVANFIALVRRSLEDKRPNDLFINQDSIKALFRVDDKSVNSR